MRALAVLVCAVLVALAAPAIVRTDTDAFIGRIEGPQPGNPLTLEQSMAQMHVPGVSIAVISDHNVPLGLARQTARALIGS